MTLVEDSPKADATKLAPSSYATGGGGTFLEQKYGASVLASLLVGDPTPGFGDDFAIDSVAFQASTESPVDDLLVSGSIGRTGAQRKLSVGIRRNPTIGASDKKFVKLVADGLRTLQRYAEQFEADQHRIAIVTAAPHTASQEISELSESARSFKAAADFFDFVETPGRVAESLRRRLEGFEGVVQAAQATDPALASLNLRELCWRLLRSLWMHQCRFEEDDVDRTQCVQRLRTIVKSADEADSLFEQLCGLAAQFGKNGGVVDRTLLRRSLAGRIAIGRDGSFSVAWRVLDSLAESFRDRTPGVLKPRTTSGRDVRIERSGAFEELAKGVRKVSSAGGVLVVTGEPGVGKSALALQVMDDLIRDAGSVTMLNLRDLGARAIVDVEQLIEGRLSDVLGATSVAASRLLLLDGAEVVQEGAGRLVGDFVRSACSAGVAAVVVTRRDAEPNVVEAVRAGLAAAGMPAPEKAIQTLSIEGFTDSETAQLVNAVPSLQRLANHPRSKWLLARPGLLKLVLENDLIANLPTGPLCETIVYGLVWQGLVRRNERLEFDGATPDGREAVVKGLARALLLQRDDGAQTVSDPRALASLRADGVLLPVRTGLVWRKGDQFASDLLRDIAVTNLFITESPQILIDAGVPRWPLYALRAAFQGFLLDANSSWTLIQQFSFCQKLVAKDGERWADVPWEAALTSSDPALLLNQHWSLLLAERGARLRELLRVLKIRFGTSETTDPHVGASVVSLLCDHRAEWPRWDYSTEEFDSTILRWLRGLASTARQDVSNALRGQVRDQLILHPENEFRHESLIEGLGLMGPDLNEAVEAKLRQLAHKRPFDLELCIESLYVGISMSIHRHGLLLELTEAYYIEKDSEDEAASWRGGHGLHDDGIRGTRHGHGSIGLHAGWTYGPFTWLLRFGKFRDTVALVNRMLNHASRIRVEKMKGLPRWFEDSDIEDGIDVELPNLGRRRFVGDAHVWRWYCGRGVGPYPCMSALLALEVYVDQLIAAGVPISKIVELLLEGAESLAMAAFVYGMLVRHVEIAGDLLDPWLATPDVWFLEVRRALEEISPYSFAARGDVVNADRRKWDGMSVVYFLAFTALSKEDKAAVSRLASIGDSLVGNAQRLYGADAEKRAELNERDKVLTCRRWAAALDAKNYGLAKTDEGIEFRFIVPRNIEEEIERGSEDLLRGRRFYELQNTYGLLRGKRPPTADQVRSDLAMVDDLLNNPPKSGPPFKADGPALLALAAIEMHRDRETVLLSDELSLSLSILVAAANGRTAFSSIEDVSVYDLGADRSAARALPLVLTSNFDWSVLDPDAAAEARQVALQCLALLSQSPVIEVRLALVDGLRNIWKSRNECSGQGPCEHRLALDLVIDAARYCHFDRSDAIGQVALVPLAVPLRESLPLIPAEELLETRLAATIGALADCAESQCCVANEAYESLPCLIEAYGRVQLDLEGGDRNAGQHGRLHVAAGLLRVALHRGDSSLLFSLLEQMLKDVEKTSLLLTDLCTVATYSTSEREALKLYWPSIMARCLDVLERTAVSRRSWPTRRFLSWLIPHPWPKPGDDQADARISEVNKDWVTPSDIGPFIDRWIALCAGVPECVDSVAWFFIEKPASDAEIGVLWLERVIDSRFDQAATQSGTVVRWLENLVKGGQWSQDTRDRGLRIIDSLAARGNTRALALQRAREDGVG